MAITITRTIEETPAVYGVPASVAVKFGYGTLTNVLAKIGTADDGVIYFGYDDTNSTGAIVSRGKLVSSKILDIKTTAAVAGKDGSVSQEAQIVISYIATDKTVKTLQIPVSASAQLKSLADRLTAVETLVGKKTDTKDPDTVFGAIAFEADRATKAEDGLNTRVTNIETLIGDANKPDEDQVINKVTEVIKWFDKVPEGDEGGKDLIADVAANKTAIGTEKTTDKPGTGIYKRIEDLEAKHKGSDVSAAEGKYVSGVKLDDTGTLSIKETALTAAGVAATPITGSATKVAVTGNNVALQIDSLATSIKSASTSATKAIEDLHVTDTSVNGQYVAEVSQTNGKIKVQRKALPTLSVNADSTQFVGVNDHVVNIKTTALNTVGLTKTEAGKWQAGTVDAKSTGLATAADVAGEIVSDEQVIATALNEHETRLKTVEDKKITVSSAKSNVAIKVAEVKDVNQVVTTAATNFNVTNGKVTFTIYNGDTAVTETITAYTEDTVKSLVELYAKEKARAEAAEAELNKKLTWINV